MRGGGNVADEEDGGGFGEGGILGGYRVGLGTANIGFLSKPFKRGDCAMRQVLLVGISFAGVVCHGGLGGGGGGGGV